jgi:hypothetical protein
LAEALGIAAALLFTFQFVVGSALAAAAGAGSSASAGFATAGNVRSLLINCTTIGVLGGWSVLFCVSPAQGSKDLASEERPVRWYSFLMSAGLVGVALTKLIGCIIFFISILILAPQAESFAVVALVGLIMLSALYLGTPLEMEQTKSVDELQNAFNTAQDTVHAVRFRVIPGICAALKHLPLHPSRMQDLETALAVAESRVVAAHTIATAAQLGIMRATATMNHSVGKPIVTSLGQLIDGMLLGVVQDWAREGVDLLVDCSSIRKLWEHEIHAQVYPFMQVVNEAINRAGTDILIYAEERPPILQATVSLRRSRNTHEPVTLLVAITQHIRGLSGQDIDELQQALGARTSSDQRWSHLALASGQLRNAGGTARIVGTGCEDLYDNGWYTVINTLPLACELSSAVRDCCVTTNRDRVLGQPLGGEVMMHIATGLDVCSRIAAVRSGHIAVASTAQALYQRKRSAASIASAAQHGFHHMSKRGAAMRGAAGSDRVASATSLLDIESVGDSDRSESAGRWSEPPPPRQPEGTRVISAIFELMTDDAVSDEDLTFVAPTPADNSSVRLNMHPLYMDFPAGVSTESKATGAFVPVNELGEAYSERPEITLQPDECVILPRLHSGSRGIRSGERVLPVAALGPKLFGSGTGGSLKDQPPKHHMPKSVAVEGSSSFVLPSKLSTEDSLPDIMAITTSEASAVK